MVIKYYSLAIELGRPVYINNLGAYYHRLKDYKSAEKYYLQAIEKGCFSISISNLAYTYQICKDFVNMKKYYFMAIKNDDFTHLTNFLDFISDNKDATALYKIFEIKPIIFNDYNYVKKIIESIEILIKEYRANTELMNIMDYIDIRHFQPPTASHIIILCKKLLSKKIELLDLHYNYSPEGKGYNEAK
jgi:tetratricopeptide (TPR) repeat protein